MVAKCPSCKAWSLNQMLNRRYMHCASCGKMYLLREVDITTCPECELEVKRIKVEH